MNFTNRLRSVNIILVGQNAFISQGIVLDHWLYTHFHALKFIKPDPHTHLHPDPHTKRHQKHHKELYHSTTTDTFLTSPLPPFTCLPSQIISHQFPHHTTLHLAPHPTFLQRLHIHSLVSQHHAMQHIDYQKRLHTTSTPYASLQALLIPTHPTTTPNAPSIPSLNTSARSKE